MTWHGCKKTMTAVAPKIVLADLDIIKNAPPALARSGFGDMVGQYIALTDWKIGNILTNEYYCEKIARMTFEATQATIASVEGVIQGDVKAYETLVYGLLLSGLAMQMTGYSRPASGAEHHISHFIEMRPEGLEVGFDARHGEKVGVGTLLVMKRYQQLLGDKEPAFYDYTGAPTEIIERIFGKERVQDIVDENLNDAAQMITGEMMQENWQGILHELSLLPDAFELETLYQKVGVKNKLPDIGVSEEGETFLLQYAPLVRSRLTLLRLLSRGVI